KWPCAPQAASTSRRRTGSCKGSPIVSVSSSRGAMAIATARERSGRFLPPPERRRVSTPDCLMTPCSSSRFRDIRDQPLAQRFLLDRPGRVPHIYDQPIDLKHPDQGVLVNH